MARPASSLLAPGLGIGLLIAASSMAAADSAPSRLPTGLRLDPAGSTTPLGNFPIHAVAAPGGERLVALLSGWREQGVQVIDRATGAVLQTLPQKAAFYGLAFSRDGRFLFASGGDSDQVARYRWADGRATPDGAFTLAPRIEGKDASRYPAGLALSNDGSRLYVAENLADTLAVLDASDGRVLARLPTGRYPFAVAVATDGRVYVSAWGGESVSVFTPDCKGNLRPARAIPAGRHPSALLLNAAGTRLFVASASTDRIAVIDTARRRRIATLFDPPPAGPQEGCTPNALALSPDGARLYVAEADANAIAVFDLSARSAGTPTVAGKGAGTDRLVGRIPVGWYPTAVLADGQDLLVVAGKGTGTGPNPGMQQPLNRRPDDSRDYTLGQLDGALTRIPASALADLAATTARVARANGWDAAPDRRVAAPAGPPFKHVVYIIKENRTYDQIFGDVASGDGDPALQFFPAPVAPNHRALAARFGLFDRFFVNAEVSAQGHPWTTSAYVTDYTEKTTPSGYSDRRPYRDEGEPDEPANGWLWTLAIAKKLPLRVYGESATAVEGAKPPRYRSLVRELRPYTSPDYPSFDMSIPDQKRLEVWLRDFRADVAAGSMPALEILHLPSDHTSGARAGKPTPRAAMADNDLALGRIVEAISASPFWKDTAIFVVEDDAQAGPDHVDSHRSVMFAISAYNRPGTVHRFVNTTDVLATIEAILNLGSLSQFDHFGRPLREIFAAEPDLSPYRALLPEVPLDELNPVDTPAAKASAALDLDGPDEADDALFNEILWRAIKGDQVPYPGPRRASVRELEFGR